jgi:hypothetical protein
VSGYEVVYAEVDTDDSDIKAAYASCPSGKRVIGGGATAFYRTSSGEFSIDNVSVTASNRGSGELWKAVAEEASGGPTHPGGACGLRATAICAIVE